MSTEEAKSRTLAILKAIENRDSAEVRTFLAADLQSILQPPVLDQSLSAVHGLLGTVDHYGHATSIKSVECIHISVPVKAQHGVFKFLCQVDQAESVTSFRFVPNVEQALWLPPSYVDIGVIDEQDICVDAVPHSIYGTLTTRKDLTPSIALVVLPGSGPTDKDGTILQNKPLKDVCWSLVSKGIVSLRIDKALAFQRTQIMTNDQFTIDDEYTNHAIAAIELLRQRFNLPDKSVFLLGHSQGGIIAPRISERCSAIRGIILMAASPTPMMRAALRQVQYLKTIDAPSVRGSDATLEETLSRQASLVESPDLASTPRADLPFNIPASYLSLIHI